MPLPVSVLVALDAKSDEILSRIIAQSAALLNVMNLKTSMHPHDWQRQPSRSKTSRQSWR